MDIFFNITTELYHDKFSKVSFSVESENLSVNFFSIILIHLVHGPMPDFVTSFVDHLANTSALIPHTSKIMLKILHARLRH